MKSFLEAVAELPCWRTEENDLIPGFSEKSEALFATVYSLIEFSRFEAKIQEDDLGELKKFALNADISLQRQREIIHKVQIACWNAFGLIEQYGRNSFIDDFVNVCLQDKKIEPIEYKLLYLVGKYLNLSKEEVSSRLRSRLSRIRYQAILFFERPWVSSLITVLIILNAVQLGLMTCPWFDPYKGKWFYRLDFAFICIFTLEILCRIFAFRKDFFKESQNVFDFVVVAASWIPAPGFRWVSAFRILRAMLLFNRLGQLKSIMRSLMDALPNIGWVSVLLFIIFYVFAVLTTNMFGQDFEAFHSLERSLFSLFQLMTLESWPELVRPIMEKYPYSWLIFIPFMIVTSYVFLNLVIGIIVTSMHDISLKKKSTEKKEIDEIRELKDRMIDMSQQIANLQKTICNKESGKK